MTNSESLLQQTTVAMLRKLYTTLVLNLSLNGISLDGLSATQRAQLIRQAKLEGMEPGIQDLTIYLPNARVLNLEFKRPKGGVQSSDQKLIEAKLQILEHTYHLVRSATEVFDLIAQYTSAEFRLSQFSSLVIPTIDGILSEPFLHWPKGTQLQLIEQQLRRIYNVE